MRCVQSEIGSEFIKKTRWHFFHIRKRTPLFHQLILSSFSVRDEKHPVDNRATHIGAFHDYVCVDEEQYTKLGNRIIRQLRKDPLFLLDIMNSIIGLREKMEKRWKRMLSLQYDRMTDNQLADVFTEYIETILCFRLSWAYPLFVEPYLENELQKGLAKLFDQSEALHWFNVAVTPVRPGLPVVEEKELLLLACKGAQTAELHRHAELFGYMANVQYDGTFYNEQYYRRKIASVSKKKAAERLAEMRVSHHKHEQEFKQFFLLLKKKGAEKLSIFAKTVNLSVFFRSYRQEIIYGSMRYMVPLFGQIVGRLHVRSPKDIFYLYWDEIDLLLRTHTLPNVTMIRQRKKGYSFLALQNGTYCAWDGDSGEAIAQAFRESLVASSCASKTDVRGTVAYAGKVIGKAFVARSLSELKRLQPGEILVTHATNINMVPYLKRASAIVTEEGGILSHASVISRELRIPCVIGTRNATAIIKTGNTIEVDARKGSVRIIHA